MTVLEICIYDKRVEVSGTFPYFIHWKVEMLICNAAQAFDCHRKELSEWKHARDDEKDTILASRPVHP